MKYLVTGKKLFKIWQQHQQFLVSRSDLVASMKEQQTSSGWWKEIAGLFIIKPRQSGKTTALAKLGRRLTKLGQPVVIVTPYNAMKQQWLEREKLSKKWRSGDVIIAASPNMDRDLQEVPTRHCHLLVDEFSFLTNQVRQVLLNREWRSVTMIGSVK